MQVDPIGSSTTPPTATRDTFSNAKQSIQKLGSALASGNLADAKTALAQLQANAPAQSSKAGAPTSASMANIAKALNEGDMKGAQQAYADIKQAASQRAPAGSGEASGTEGASPAVEKKAVRATGGSNSTRVYNKRDTNKDGVVSKAEERAYEFKHPGQATGASVAVGVEKSGTRVNTTA